MTDIIFIRLYTSKGQELFYLYNFDNLEECLVDCRQITVKIDLFLQDLCLGLSTSSRPCSGGGYGDDGGGGSGHLCKIHVIDSSEAK